MSTQRIVFEENEERVKITIPLERQTMFWALYTTMLIAWIVGSIWGLSVVAGYIRAGDFGFDGVYLYAYFLILLTVAAIWFQIGRKVWKQWQYFSSTREILFFYPDRLIVRRPFSLLGVTDGYARQHISRFSMDSKLNCPAFDYGNYRIPVGMTLPPEEGEALISEINSRFYANIPEEIEEDDY